ncbi:MAG: N-terminal phage integrase SAM-like domain-containing protein, partial [Clostridiales bacterium]|nr:N-terminal phage integrase SAM-like domain-containing protein [Clostridiales bacterium]
MAKYKKRADGRYCTSIMLNIDGEKKKKYVYGKTIKDVDDKIAELRAQNNKGELTNGKSITVEEWAKTWLEVYKRPSVSYNTFKGYRIAAEDHVIPNLGKYQLSALRPNQLQGLLNKLCDNNKVPIARKVKIVLDGMIKTAIREKYIKDNIADGLKLAPHKPKEKRALTDDEIKAIFAADLSDKERAF